MIHGNLPLSSPGAPPSAAPLNSGSTVQLGLPATGQGSGFQQVPARQGTWEGCLPPQRGIRALCSAAVPENLVFAFLFPIPRASPSSPAPLSLPRPTRMGLVATGPKKREKLSTEHSQAPGDLEARLPRFCLQQQPPPPQPFILLEQRESKMELGRRGENNRDQFSSCFAGYSWSKLPLQT